jgi:hypothetical protein
VLVAKYADHLPLYRQAQIYARQGVQLIDPPGRLGGRAAWYLRPCAITSLSDCDDQNGCLPTRRRRRCSIRGGRTKTGQLWAYARDDRPGAAMIRRWSPMSPQPKANGQKRISVILRHPAGRWLWRLCRARQAQPDQPRFLLAHVRKLYELADSSPVATEVLRRVVALCHRG